MKIGLALSGGGALGAAHIGVLEILEQYNIKIDTISGSSVGAIVGFLYAAGGTKALNDFFNQIVDSGIFQPKNIIKSPRTDRIFREIEEMLHQTLISDFSQLKIKFNCVATDIETGKIKIFNSGNPIKAVMASAAYPGVFPIQTINNHFYIDGGTRQNLPVTPLRKQNCDFIIASSIYHLPKINMVRKLSRIQTVVRALEVMECALNENELKKSDFSFFPPVRKYFWYDFSQIKKILNISKRYSKKRVTSLLPLLSQATKKQCQKNKRPTRIKK